MTECVTDGFGAVIVNYNTAPLALDAALSFLGGGGKKVILVDNASVDDSVVYLRRVLSGEVTHNADDPNAPVKNGRVCFADISDLRWSICESIDDSDGDEDILILTPKLNRGFAAGVNIGLSALLTLGFERYLLLNPDAVISAGTLDAFNHRLIDREIGLCGASVIDFTAPHHVQALGGARFNRFTLTGANIGEGNMLSSHVAREKVERNLRYPLGAAVAFRRDFLSIAGFLDERYFLYYEEIDWALAGARQYKVGWAPGAIVFHRYGASTKSAKSNSRIASRRSSLSDYHMVRSRALFASKWMPWLAPTSLAFGICQAVVRVLRGDFANARAVLLGSMPRATRIFQET